MSPSNPVSAADCIRQLLRDASPEVQQLFDQILAGEPIDSLNASHAARQIAVAFRRAKSGKRLATALSEFRQIHPG